MSRIDRGILLAVFTLVGIGLVQVYSSSFIFAAEARGDGLYFFKRQIFFACLGMTVLFSAAMTPWWWIERWGFLLWIVAACAVALTFIPGAGVSAGGAARWLRLPGGNVFEPSELLKVALPLIMATFLSRRMQVWGRYEMLIKGAIIVLPLLLVLLQKDFGGFFICGIVLFSLLFAFGLRARYICIAAALALPLLKVLVWDVPYRRLRVQAFLDPWADPDGDGFQLIQSMLAFRSGSLTGTGWGQGQGKLFFLPEAHTDFTLAVLGEETGFIGFLLVVSLYGYLVWRGLRVSARVPDGFSRALALGLSLTFGFQVFINVGVNLGLLPPKGLTLPFLSYGGSSLVATCLLFGLLLNVGRTLSETKAG